MSNNQKGEPRRRTHKLRGELRRQKGKEKEAAAIAEGRITTMSNNGHHSNASHDTVSESSSSTNTTVSSSHLSSSGESNQNCDGGLLGKRPVTTTDEMCSRIDRDNKRLKAYLRNGDKKTQELQATIKTLQEELRATAVTMNEKAEENKTINKSNLELQATIKTLQEELRATAVTMNEKAEENKTVNKSNLELQATIKSLQEKLRATSVTMKKAAEEIDSSTPPVDAPTLGSSTQSTQ